MSGYTKLFSSILHSTIWLEANHVRLVWITMLAMANRKGEVQASVPGLAVAARVSLQECDDALAKFLAPDPHSRTKDHDGRRIAEVDGGWLLLTYEKHRKALSQEAKREADAERQRRSRDRKRAASTEPEKRDIGVTCHDESSDSNGVTCDPDRARVASGSASGSASDDLLDPDPPDRLGLAQRAERYLRDECGERLEASGPAETWPEVLTVIGTWRDVWGPVELRTGLRDARLRVILERFADGYQPGTLCKAIRGARLDKFTAGNRNAARLESVLKGPARVDKFIEFYEDPPAKEKPDDAPARGLAAVEAIRRREQVG